MDAANGSGFRLSLRHALAGLQAGVLGALFMLGWIMTGSFLNRRSIWVVPNLFASIFYGPNAYRNEFLRSSWTGAALFIAIYGALGIVWGCACRETTRPRLWLFGVLYGIASYYALFDVVWKHVDGLIGLYAPTRTLILAHVIWGMILAKSPKYARRIADFNRRTAAQEEEVRSGEFIR